MTLTRAAGVSSATSLRDPKGQTRDSSSPVRAVAMSQATYTTEAERREAAALAALPSDEAREEPLRAEAHHQRQTVYVASPGSEPRAPATAAKSGGVMSESGQEGDREAHGLSTSTKPEPVRRGRSRGA